MRFLADENRDFAVVRALRSDGHDVPAVSEFQQRSVDRQLMEMAYNEGRILLTEDKDLVGSLSLGVWTIRASS